MKLLVLILNKIESTETILEKFNSIGISGATIIQSQGMARALSSSEYKRLSFLDSMRFVLNPDNTENRTIITIINDDQVFGAVAAIEDVVGSLDKPDTGVVFTLPIGECFGIPNL